MLPRDRTESLFLDIDGVLLELACTPELVHVPDRLVELLYQLSDRLHGAVALVSGRAVDDVDRLFKPYRFATVGIHGCERRGLDGTVRGPSISSETMNLLHDECSRFVGDSAGLFVEYKPCGVGIHYRMAREEASRIRMFLHGLAHHIGPKFSVMESQDVCEIRPAGYSLGTAILEMMEAPPFMGRRPIYIGNHQAQAAFEAVNGAGGMTIEVGTSGPTVAALRIANTRSVHRVLGALLQGLRDGSSLSWLH